MKSDENRDEFKVPGTNGGSLRSRSPAAEQPMFDFGPRMQFLCVKLGKIPLNEPPLVPGTLIPQLFTFHFAF